MSQMMIQLVHSVICQTDSNQELIWVDFEFQYKH